MGFIIKVNHPESDTHNAKLAGPFATEAEALKKMEEFELHDDGCGIYWVEEEGKPPKTGSCTCSACREFNS